MQIEAGAGLPRWLLARRVVDAAALDQARARRRVYGGGLDTALLELGLCDEATVRRALEEGSGLPAAEPSWLRETGRGAARFISARDARRLRAQPVAELRGRLEIVVGPEADLEAVMGWAEVEHETSCRFHLASEVAFESLFARIHAAPLPARFRRLVARLDPGGVALGQVGLAPATRVVPPPLCETGPVVVLPPPEPVIDVTEDLTDVAAWVAPRVASVIVAPAIAPPVAPAVTPPVAPAIAPPVLAFAEAEDDPTAVSPAPVANQLLQVERWRAELAAGGPDAAGAIAALAEARDTDVVPELIALLEDRNPALRTAAEAALRTLTAHDFGGSRWRWSFWWRTWGKRHRVEWLLEALSAADPERRLRAAQELERISGVYVGYHFDLSRPEREAARRRWQRWWQERERGKA